MAAHQSVQDVILKHLGTKCGRRVTRSQTNKSTKPQKKKHKRGAQKPEKRVRKNESQDKDKRAY
jgi:hypothetical protein